MEFGLKALLIQRQHARGKMKTHSLFTLVKAVCQIDPWFFRFDSKAWHLDTLYYCTRYPFGETAKLPRDFFTNAEEATDALGVAQEVLHEIRLVTEQIPED